MQKDEYLDLYHQMVLIRRVEERAAETLPAGQDRRISALIHRARSGQHRFNRCPPAQGSHYHRLPGPWGGDQCRDTSQVGDGRTAREGDWNFKRQRGFNAHG